MNFEEIINEIDNNIINKEFEVAEKKLVNLIESSKNKKVEDEETTYYCFNNYIDVILYYTKYNTEKPNRFPDIDMTSVYYRLGYICNERKEYQKALEYLNIGLQWNPVDVKTIFEKASIYRNIGELERFKAEIDKTHPMIVSNGYLAKYYRELGYYYIEKGIYDLANALYSMSVYIISSPSNIDMTSDDIEKSKGMAINELMYIAEKEKREMKFTMPGEIKPLLEDYNIPMGFNEATQNILYKEWQRLLQKDGKTETTKLLSDTLYSITNDNRFVECYTIENKEYGISLRVPENWSILLKSKYKNLGIEENTIFIFKNKDNQTISIVSDGECKVGEFFERYKLCIDNMRKAGIVVLGENTLKLDNGLRIKQVVIEVNNNNRITRMIQNYIRINDYLLNISWDILTDVEINKQLQMVNNSIEMQLVTSIMSTIGRNSKVVSVDQIKYMVGEKPFSQMNMKELENEKAKMQEFITGLKKIIDNPQNTLIDVQMYSKINNAKKNINELEQRIEYIKNFDDINEVVITIGKNIYRIKENEIKQFNSDNTLIGKNEISLNEFKLFVNTEISKMCNWEKSYVANGIVENANWSIMIKFKNSQMKRYSGNNDYPYNWSDFYNEFIMFVERSNIKFFEETFIKVLIYFLLATQKENELTLTNCMRFATSIDLEDTINRFPLQHPARVLYNTLNSLTDSQYQKMLIETTNILSMYIMEFPDDDANLILTIESEKEVDAIANKIVEHYYNTLEEMYNSIDEKMKNNKNIDNIVKEIAEKLSKVPDGTEISLAHYVPENIELDEMQCIQVLAKLSNYGIELSYPNGEMEEGLLFNIGFIKTSTKNIK